MELFLGFLLGAIVSYFGTVLYKKQVKLYKTQKQSLVLVEKIKSVCKLISVEGEFAEIYHYEDKKNRFLNLFSSKKKAVLLINAKVLVGFDLTKIKLETKSESREIVMTHFPDPTILSVETDVKYFDKKEGLFNKFEAVDLTLLNEKSKEFIIDKVPQSGLLKSAKNEAVDTIVMIEKLLEPSGWKLIYNQLMLPEKKKNLD